jgi:hypothetical protein
LETEEKDADSRIPLFSHPAKVFALVKLIAMVRRLGE